ncbi:MAG: hypothetical protein ABF533_09115, partial [Acetobacter persici]|uniref:hypothetical protein n=1 Tax=Acetobacter persici TaxID=1076596 RepID=UPI0039EB2D04
GIEGKRQSASQYCAAKNARACATTSNHVSLFSVSPALARRTLISSMLAARKHMVQGQPSFFDAARSGFVADVFLSGDDHSVPAGCYGAFPSQ